MTNRTPARDLLDMAAEIAVAGDVPTRAIVLVLIDIARTLRSIDLEHGISDCAKSDATKNGQ